jgi:hypothetical protein
VTRLIAPPRHGVPDAAQVRVLFAEARRRRRRRRLAAAVAGLVLAGLAVALSSGGWPHQAGQRRSGLGGAGPGPSRAAMTMTERRTADPEAKLT